VTVRGDLRVRVPDEIFGAREWACTVRSTRSVSTLVRELVLDLQPGEEMRFRAGAFVQVTCPPHHLRFADFEIDPAFRDDWARLGLRRYESACSAPQTRAYSLANHPGERVVMLNVRIALPPPGAAEGTPPGVVSSYLFAVRPGDVVTVSGPYGHFFATESNAEMVFIGGGVGMAPMRSHILDQLEQIGSDRTITFWYGARNRREIFYADELDRLAAEHDNFRWSAALSDPDPGEGWTGYTGFIHDVVYERYLKDHPAPEDCEYYVCGPPVMMLAVRSMLDGLGVEPQNIHYDDFGG
jgi:Na+-transporting NADH:ubiquinone oxidoreductase subunit F